VNTQGVRQPDAWAQFVKLTAEARQRNQALSNTKAKDSATGTFSIDNRQSVSGKPKVNFVNNLSFSATAPINNNKTLGRLFDAYA
jgi:hypothetical protein